MKPIFYNISSICFIYGFVDIQNDSEITEWQRQIEEQKNITEFNKKAVIVVMRENSKGFNEISESAHLCLKLSEEKYKSDSYRQQFIQVINDYLTKSVGGNGIWEMKSMSRGDNTFEFISDAISLVEFENSTFDIVRKTIEKMIQTINRPQDVLFLINFSTVPQEESAGEIFDITNEIDKKGNTYWGIYASKENYLEITILGTDFE